MAATLTHLCNSPPFDEAKSTFRAFLIQQGCCDTIHWIWRNTIISRRRPGSHSKANRRIFIDKNRLADEAEIRRYYATGVERQLGIALRVFCLANGIPMCYVDIPEDKIAAEYAMMSSLKCSIPDPCPTATLVDSKRLACLLRFVIRIPSDAWLTNAVPLRPVAS